MKTGEQRTANSEQPTSNDPTGTWVLHKGETGGRKFGLEERLAESAESREDFIHKPKLCLKELRETRYWGRLIQTKGGAKTETPLLSVLSEAEQLIRIFRSSIRTTKQNLLAQRRKPASAFSILPATPASHSIFGVQCSLFDVFSN